MKSLKTLVAAVAVAMSAQAHAGYIVASADSNLNQNNPQLSNFYSNLFSGQDVLARNGWTVTNTSSTMQAVAGSFSFDLLSAAALVGKEWFVASTNTEYTQQELDLLTSFVGGGGNLLVFGEHQAYATVNTNGNAVLMAVGSSMRFGAGLNNNTVWGASGANIGNHALTAGITQFGGNFFTGITGGGTMLFTDNQTGAIALAVEGADNPAAVPEPASLMLMGLGLLAMLGLRRKV